TDETGRGSVQNVDQRSGSLNGGPVEGRPVPLRDGAHGVEDAGPRIEEVRVGAPERVYGDRDGKGSRLAGSQVGEEWPGRAHFADRGVGYLRVNLVEDQLKGRGIRSDGAEVLNSLVHLRGKIGHLRPLVRGVQGDDAGD